MQYFKIRFLLALMLCLPMIALAQDDCTCCTEHHAQFDFWLGEWVVKNDQGQRVGENSISKIEDNCIMLEKWKGAKGTTGTSHNYYDSSDQTWNQLWIDNSGKVLKLKGGLQGDSMVMKGDVIKGGKGDLFYNQISWIPESDGTVLQLWEIFDSKGQLLQTVFKGYYFKRDED
ncbi:hypothetical protein [Lutimonas sp.]|uniref:hypothetical protein n=1 Tax=Lutimonas sp. TaxID=1872403 RepID=UPI003D9BE33E